MSSLSILYSPAGGIYGSVKPITDVPPPVVTDTPGISWEPLPQGEFHATVCYDRDTTPSAEVITAWLARRGVDDRTVWRAHPASTVQHWVNAGKLYLGLELYSPELFAFQEDALASLGIKRSFPTYKCHITFGKWRGLDALGLLDDRVFLNDFVSGSVSASIPASIELSLLDIRNANPDY